MAGRAGGKANQNCEESVADSEKPQDGRLIDLTSAGVRLSLSYHQVHRLMLIGDLEGERVGGRWYLNVSSVERYRSQQSKATSPARRR